MQIKNITPYILYTELSKQERFAYSQYWYNSRTAMIVAIECDDGTTGYGEASGPPWVNAATIDTVYTPLLIGRDPLDRDTLWLEMYNRLRDHGQKGTAIEAISAIDIALWDIAGKHFGVPIYKLAGRCYRNTVTAYATGLYHRDTDDNVSALVNEAKGYVAQGFKAMKVKIGFGVESDLTVVKAIREAVGSDIALMIDANHAYDVSASICLSRKLEPLNIRWFEEPIVPEDISGYRQLTSHATIPIATGEAEFTRYGFRDLIYSKAADIMQPDCCVAGGLSEVLKIADMADACHIRVIPHVWGSSISIAVALQLLSMIAPCPPALYPEEPLLELDRTPNIFREELAKDGLEIQNGIARVPTAPGLGIEIDHGILEKYRIPR